MVNTAKSIGANTFAFFTRNPRGSKAKAEDPVDAAAAVKALNERNFGKLVAHGSYTMNLCTQDPEARQFAAEILCDDLRRMAVAKIDENAKVLHLEEKPKEPKSDVAVFATYIYQKDTIKKIRTYLDEGNSPDAPGNFPAWLYSKQPVYLYLFEGECFDIGTPDSYAYVNELLEKGGNK